MDLVELGMIITRNVGSVQVIRSSNERLSVIKVMSIHVRSAQISSGCQVRSTKSTVHVRSDQVNSSEVRSGPVT